MNLYISKNLFYLIVQKQLFTLFLKTNKKKLINIFTLFVQIKNSLIHKTPLSVFYRRFYFLFLLNVLKQEFFIFDYFLLYRILVPKSLYTRVEKQFLSSLVCIVFRSNSFGSLKFFRFIFLSTPGRIIYVTIKQLKYLTSLNCKIVYVLNTVRGLLTHKEALKYNVGGSLLCKFY